MKTKVYALGKSVVIGVIIAAIFTVVIDVFCAICALVSNIGDREDSVIIFALLLFCVVDGCICVDSLQKRDFYLLLHYR